MSFRTVSDRGLSPRELNQGFVTRDYKPQTPIEVMLKGVDRQYDCKVLNHYKNNASVVDTGIKHYNKGFKKETLDSYVPPSIRPPAGENTGESTAPKPSAKSLISEMEKLAANVAKSAAPEGNTAGAAPSHPPATSVLREAQTPVSNLKTFGEPGASAPLTENPGPASGPASRPVEGESARPVAPPPRNSYTQAVQSIEFRRHIADLVITHDKQELEDKKQYTKPLTDLAKPITDLAKPLDESTPRFLQEQVEEFVNKPIDNVAGAYDRMKVFNDFAAAVTQGINYLKFNLSTRDLTNWTGTLEDYQQTKTYVRDNTREAVNRSARSTHEMLKKDYEDASKTLAYAVALAIDKTGANMPSDMSAYRDEGGNF